MGKLGRALGKSIVVASLFVVLIFSVSLFGGNKKNLPSFSQREETFFVSQSSRHLSSYEETPEFSLSEEEEDTDEEEWCPGGEGKDPEVRSVVLVIATILIVLSIFFEEAREKIEEASDELVHPVIEHTWEELTVLGFLSLISFLIVKVKLTEKIACSLGFEEKDGLDELVESVHMLLFFVMVLFIVFVFLMVKLGRSFSRKAHHNEELCRQSKTLAVKFLEAVRIRETRGIGLHTFLPAYFDPTEEVFSAMQYMGVRNAFINPRDATHRILPPDFDFAYYTSLLLAELLGEMVEITIPIWVTMEIVLVILWGFTYLSADGFAIVWCVLGWLFLLGGLAMTISLHNIKDLVTPSVTSVSFPDQEGNVNADPLVLDENSKLLKEEMRSHAVEDRYTHETVLLQSIRPPYLGFTLHQRSDFGKMVLGKPPNKHEMCFPFDRHGVHFYIQVFRLIIVLMSLYLALTIVHFPKQYYALTGDSAGLTTLMMILSIFPLLVVVFYVMPTSIVTLVMVSNIEKMRKKEIIAKVLRDMHTRKALKLLTMLQMLQFYTRKSKVGLVKDSQAQDKRDPGLGDNLTPEKREDLREVFEMFDTDGSGFVDSEELTDILSLLGEEITPQEALDLIATIDEDGDRRMNFNEFCAFMSLHQKTHPTQHVEEMVESLFGIFDKDGSGSVTAAEFRETMLRVCRGKLEEEDLDMVIEDIDKDDDGEIDLKEFEEMLKFYLKQE